MTRPSFAPTALQRELVEKLAAQGIPHEQMLYFFPQETGKQLALNTFKKHFKTELQTGKVKANFKISDTLYQKAINGDTTAMIFWLKTRAGWKQTEQIELTGKDGVPLNQPSPDLRNLNYDELDQLETLATKAFARTDSSGEGGAG